MLLRQALVRVLRSDRTWPHAQIISYPRDPGSTKYIFSMWAFNERGFFDILEEYCDFCADYERRTGYRCDLPAVGYAIAKDRGSLLSYSWDFPTLCIDPTSTGGEAPEFAGRDEAEVILGGIMGRCEQQLRSRLLDRSPGYITHGRVKLKL